MRNDTITIIENNWLAGFPPIDTILFPRCRHLPVAVLFANCFIRKSTADAARIKNATSRAEANKETCSADEWGPRVS